MPRNKGTGKRDKAGTGNNKGVKAARAVSPHQQPKEEPPDEQEGPQSSDEGDADGPDEDAVRRRQWSSYLRLRKQRRHEARAAHAVPPATRLTMPQVHALSMPGPTIRAWVGKCTDAELRAARADCESQLQCSPAHNDICTCAPRTPIPSFLCKGWRCYAFEVGCCDRPSDWSGHDDEREGCGKDCMGWDDDDPMGCWRR
jgi:hypothetical protein